jgi:CubicO group peptidase (beta-lactamase class C family)
MRCITILSYLIVLNAIALSAENRIDSLLNQMTIYQKVKVLFVEQPDPGLPDSLVLGDAVAVFDTRKGLKDALSIPYPNENTLRAIQDEVLCNELYFSVLSGKSTQGYQALVVPDECFGMARLFTGNPLIDASKHYFRIVDFPCDLIDELLNSKAGAKSDMQGKVDFDMRALGLPSMDIWSATNKATVSLNQLMNFNFLFWKQDDMDCVTMFIKAIESGLISEEELNQKVRSLLNKMNLIESGIAEMPKMSDNVGMRAKAFRKSISIYQKETIFPIHRLDSVDMIISDAAVSNAEEFNQKAGFYKAKLNKGENTRQLQFLLCDNEILLSKALDDLEAGGDEPSTNYILVYVGNIGHSKLSRALRSTDAVVLMPEQTDGDWSLVAQAVFGGSTVDGKAVYHDFLEQNSFKRFVAEKTRLGFEQKELVTLPKDSVAKIDSIVYDALRKEAMPGAQLMVVKNGSIVLQKNYGYHTYKKQQKVVDGDLYDVASITKLAVTFPLVMQLYERGMLSLDAPLKEYLPGIDTTDKADLTVRELLLHQSGLISYIPFHTNALDTASLGKQPLYSRHYSRLHNIRVDTRLYQNRHARYRKDVFSNEHNEVFTRQLTEHMFMNEAYVDSMYAAIYSSKLNDKKVYRYSDLGYYLLQKIIERESKQRIDSIFYQQLSMALGAEKLMYCPLSLYEAEQIVPTENDLAFRREQLDGYAHDQGAAMLGGVAAHAGLFANAGDLAKLSQMLLNEGAYGGIRFLKPETVGMFTQAANSGNRRGLGVDKPELNSADNTHVSKRVSPASYGHTGFTGTILWIDPEYELIYIFLSNRIHPHAYNKKLIEMNVRTQIQDVIYNSIQY